MLNIVYGIIYKLPLIYIIFAMLLLGLFWNYMRSVSQKDIRKIIVWKCGNTLILLGIIIAVARITLYTRSSTTTEVILIPFHSFVEARVQPEMYRSMLMNVFLFFPIGLSMPNILPEKWKHSALVAVVFAFLLSFGIEFLQYCYQLGRVEVDDVICNTFGCMVGTLSYLLERRFTTKRSLQQK